MARGLFGFHPHTHSQTQLRDFSLTQTGSGPGSDTGTETAVLRGLNTCWQSDKMSKFSSAFVSFIYPINPLENLLFPMHNLS